MRYLILLLLFGCGSGGDNPYGSRVDAVGATGLKVQYDTQVDSSVLALLESEYATVEGCTNLSAPPPLVVITSPGKLAPNSGYTYFNPPEVVVEPSLVSLRHEYIHYLLAMTGFPADDNTNHRSPLFDKCSGYAFFDKVITVGS